MGRPLSRREMLAGAAAGALLPAVGMTRAARGADARWPMRLSTSSIHFKSLPLEQACERIAALGFEAIDIWSEFGGCKHLPDALKLGGPGLRDLLARHKLALFAFSVYAGGYPKYAELLGQAGGGVAIRGSAKPCKPEELTARMKEFLEGLKPEIDLAEKHNAYLAVENHGRALLDSLDSFKAFVDLNAHPRVGIALAPYHLQGIKASVEEAVAIAGKQLLFFYAWQRASKLEQLPGIGPADATPWLAALAKAGYRGYVNPFMHNEPEPETMAEALQKSRDYLKTCYAKAAAG
jgi:sugar phosphate isomerase/epimerase